MTKYTCYHCVVLTEDCYRRTVIVSKNNKITNPYYQINNYVHIKHKI